MSWTLPKFSNHWLYFKIVVSGRINHISVMSAILEKITQDAFSLSSEERASLAQALLHSLDEQVDEDRDHLWDEEIKRRVELIDSGKADGRDAEEVFRDIELRFKS